MNFADPDPDLPAAGPGHRLPLCCSTLGSAGTTRFMGSLCHPTALRAFNHTPRGLGPHLAEILQAVAGMPLADAQALQQRCRDLEAELERLDSAPVRKVQTDLTDIAARRRSMVSRGRQAASPDPHC